MNGMLLSRRRATDLLCSNIQTCQRLKKNQQNTTWHWAPFKFDFAFWSLFFSGSKIHRKFRKSAQGGTLSTKSWNYTILPTAVCIDTDAEDVQLKLWKSGIFMHFDGSFTKVRGRRNNWKGTKRDERSSWWLLRSVWTQTHNPLVGVSIATVSFGETCCSQWMQSQAVSLSL